MFIARLFLGQWPFLNVFTNTPCDARMVGVTDEASGVDHAAARDPRQHPGPLSLPKALYVAMLIPLPCVGVCFHEQ